MPPEADPIARMEKWAGRSAENSPYLVAHRGLPRLVPENTLASYRLVIESGLDMAECDVRLSANRVPVLMHDESLERTTGVARKVGELSTIELAELDAGSWKDPRFGDESVPTLKEALSLAKGQLRFFVELKEPDMESSVVRAVHESGIHSGSVMVFSWFEETPLRMAKAGIPAVWLMVFPEGDLFERKDLVRRVVDAGFFGLGLHFSKADRSRVELAHGAGLPVFVWTVNDEEDLERMATLGVDVVMTDRADELSGFLRRGR